MQVVDVDAIDLGAKADGVGRAVGDAALDASASQPDREAMRVVVAARPLSDMGIRPNSPPQITRVSSSRPRRLRSLSRPAIGLSVCRHMRAWFASTSSCASQPLTSPE